MHPGPDDDLIRGQPLHAVDGHLGQRYAGRGNNCARAAPTVTRPPSQSLACRSIALFSISGVSSMRTASAARPPHDEQRNDGDPMDRFEMVTSHAIAQPRKGC